MESLRAAIAQMEKYKNLSARGGAWDGVEDDARDARNTAAVYAAIAQAEMLERIADELEAMGNAQALREKDIYVQAYEDAQADAVRADTDSLEAALTADAEAAYDRGYDAGVTSVSDYWRGYADAVTIGAEERASLVTKARAHMKEVYQSYWDGRAYERNHGERWEPLSLSANKEYCAVCHYVAADTDSLRAADWPTPVANGDAPSFEHGIEVGRKRLITEIQNGEWPPELQDVPPADQAPQRWEPVDVMPWSKCPCGCKRHIQYEDGEIIIEGTMADDDKILTAELPDGYAICRRVDTKPERWEPVDVAAVTVGAPDETMYHIAIYRGVVQLSDGAGIIGVATLDDGAALCRRVEVDE